MNVSYEAVRRQVLTVGPALASAQSACLDGDQAPLGAMSRFGRRSADFIKVSSQRLQQRAGHMDASVSARQREFPSCAGGGPSTKGRLGRHQLAPAGEGYESEAESENRIGERRIRPGQHLQPDKQTEAAAGEPAEDGWMPHENGKAVGSRRIACDESLPGAPPQNNLRGRIERHAGQDQTGQYGAAHGSRAIPPEEAGSRWASSAMPSANSMRGRHSKLSHSREESAVM